MTRDVDRPLRIGRELKAGTVWTNTWAAVHDQFEEGGFKQSGVGRLKGIRGLEEFSKSNILSSWRRRSERSHRRLGPMSTEMEPAEVTLLTSHL
ncbi:aldehyde dehydrogenase [Mycolicibacterium canariasense]|uniref:Aldehyde dehydrogenase n=1 Tax=Mycolicibacterium canariasense TaxID=228230 RepID=A0A100WEX7_MYCCR|nr:aldehyde dehydrogenase family protein [Mycolicibacterium canariasense]ORV05176.1 hypothetical protein AWB94_20530 [Mycolicibacterium canariasense]GAS96811.1 aldehyde dehydrogenase [Mycolicibacterium canariasense]